MPITPPPATPSRTNPLTFSPRMDAFLAWFPTFVTDYNNDAALMGRRYVTYGGTANAITLTGALPAGASSIPVGTQVRFRATSANTGATTINLDGVGAVACRTITGVALPSGYIRTGVDTVASFDGTYWVLDRQIEHGSNANGDFVRFPDGTQVCLHTISSAAGTSSAAGNGFQSADDTWTFPAAFSTVNGLVVTGASSSGGRWITTPSLAVGSVGIRQNGWLSSTATFLIRVQATGFWY